MVPTDDKENNVEKFDENNNESEQGNTFKHEEPKEEPFVEQKTYSINDIENSINDMNIDYDDLMKMEF